MNDFDSYWTMLQNLQTEKIITRPHVTASCKSCKKESLQPNDRFQCLVSKIAMNTSKSNTNCILRNVMMFIFVQLVKV